MQNSPVSATPRRSSRVPINIPILVTSLEPAAHFSEVCETLVVSAHGCAMRSPMKLDAGVPLHLHSKDGRETEARVVYCQPLGSDQGWRLGAKLERPENFWGLASCPQDWPRLLAPTAAPVKTVPPAPATQPRGADQAGLTAPALKAVLDQIQKQVSDEHLRAKIAELLQPLQAEMAEIKEKQSRADHKRSRFEVSLTQIPPEVEEAVEQRLRKELTPRLLNEAREQSAQVLTVAKSAIEQKTAESHAEFVQRVSQELKSVEQRAQSLSANIYDGLRKHLRDGQDGLQQQMIDAGNRLKKLSEDLHQVLQHNLQEEHDARRQELQQVQRAVASEASRLQEEIANIDGRITKLDESARRLESGLEQRLAQMGSDTVSSARSQIESATDRMLADLTNRNAEVLGKQIEDASSHLRIIQKGIEGSASDSLKIHVAEAVKSFDRSIEEMAQESAERWRQALAGRLDSLFKVLGEQLRVDSESGEKQGHRAGQAGA